MRIVFWAALPLLLSAALAAAQSAPAAPGVTVQNAPSSQAGQNTPGMPAIAAGGIIPAELTKTLDAKKAKTGDRFEGRTTMDLLAHGQIILPRNSKIVGHVVSAKAHTKDSPDSSLELAFDRILLKDGREMPAQVGLQAIGRPLQNGVSGSDISANAGLASSPRGGGSMGSAGAPTMSGPSMSNPAGPSAASPYPTNSGSDPGDTGATPNGGTTVAPLGPTSEGAVGMRGLSLSGSGSSVTLRSSSQNVHLDAGTQLMLRTQ